MKSNKIRLFEVMGRLDNTFKSKPNELNENSSTSPMRKYVYFSFNYPYDFISKVWADDQNLATHLQGKFDGIYDKYGAKAAMNSFFVELDAGNQQKLEDWIQNNYNG